VVNLGNVEVTGIGIMMQGLSFILYLRIRPFICPLPKLGIKEINLLFADE
jgi:hypothetical protein